MVNYGPGLDYLINSVVVLQFPQLYYWMRLRQQRLKAMMSVLKDCCVVRSNS